MPAWSASPIGFGAQTLVKDLITGLFILAGDTVRVGDVVDLGGKAGVVEAISMRTITLRAYNGDVHTIPFSSIDVVTNMTKDFSYYVFDVIVAYKENVDRVVEVLREIDSQLRREWPYRRLMLEPLEIAGVDAFREFGRPDQSRGPGYGPASSGRSAGSSIAGSSAASTSWASSCPCRSRKWCSPAARPRTRRLPIWNHCAGRPGRPDGMAPGMRGAALALLLLLAGCGSGADTGRLGEKEPGSRRAPAAGPL